MAKSCLRAGEHSALGMQTGRESNYFLSPTFPPVHALEDDVVSTHSGKGYLLPLGCSFISPLLSLTPIHVCPKIVFTK